MTVRMPESLMREWDNDPNFDELWTATGLLDSDPLLALAKLETLAANGSALSMVYIGNTYLAGLKVKQDISVGVDWMRRAAVSGSIEGGYRLARHYYQSGELEKAKTELVKLGERGYSPAWFTLGSIYYEGQGGARNLDEAIKCWKKSKDLGHLLAKHSLSYVMRTEIGGISFKLKSYFMWISIVFPILYCKVFYSSSDRIKYWSKEDEA